MIPQLKQGTQSRFRTVVVQFLARHLVFLVVTSAYDNEFKAQHKNSNDGLSTRIKPSHTR